MSSRIAFRRSPKPGALTAATCRVPRSLLRLGNVTLKAWRHPVVESVDRVLEHGFHALGVGHEAGRGLAAVKLHAFHDVPGRLRRCL